MKEKSHAFTGIRTMVLLTHEGHFAVTFSLNNARQDQFVAFVS